MRLGFFAMVEIEVEIKSDSNDNIHKVTAIVTYDPRHCQKEDSICLKQISISYCAKLFLRVRETDEVHDVLETSTARTVGASSFSWVSPRWFHAGDE